MKLQPTTTEKLDCNGEHSALNECWPAWVNIGVPVILSTAFIFILAIIYFVWPSPEEESEVEEGCPGTWISREHMLEIEGSSYLDIKNEAECYKLSQIDEENRV